mgnify:CR=1 FL=1
MGRKIWKIGLLFFSCLLIPLLNIQAAGLFQHHAAGPVILIGEVQSYGDYESKSAIFNTFADQLNQQLQAKKNNCHQPERYDERSRPS